MEVQIVKGKHLENAFEFFKQNFRMKTKTITFAEILTKSKIFSNGRN
jgi:hypothetical protein